jgi:hypothetical protein
VFLLVATSQLIPGGSGQFGYRTQASFGGFINLVTITFPIGAVLLALLVQPRHPKAQLIVVAALVEYAVMAFFGVLFGVLIGLINEAGNNGARSAFEGLLVRVAWLAVFAVAAYAVFLIWRNMFFTPRPKPQPGVYGQPAYNQPGTFPGQPGYGPGQPMPGHPMPGHPMPGQPMPGHPMPGQPMPGQPMPGQPGFPPQPPGGYPPPAPGQPVPGQQGFGPGVYGQPAPSWNQPPMTMPTPAAETQAVPQSPAPTSGAPVYPSPAATEAADPTQVVPRAEIDDRTQKIADERPGFGPADQDPPRQ